MLEKSPGDPICAGRRGLWVALNSGLINWGRSELREGHPHTGLARRIRPSTSVCLAGTASFVVTNHNSTVATPYPTLPPAVGGLFETLTSTPPISANGEANHVMRPATPPFDPRGPWEIPRSIPFARIGANQPQPQAVP